MYSEAVLDFLKKAKIDLLDYVEIIKENEVFEGIILNRPDYLSDDTLILKLNNGYNIGVNIKRVTGIKLLKKYKEEKVGNKKNAKLGKGFISILHTGGTIASKVDYRTGGVVSRFNPDELIEMFPGLSNYGPINSLFMGNMFSDDMRFSHYKKMAEFVFDEVKKGSKGVIITHGTDTMSYSSAALSFILENVPIPVLLVGAQRSSDRPSSDAEMNIVCAAKFIRKTDFCGVAICMHNSSSDDACAIIRGVNARKLHSSRRDAFKQINDDLIAIVEYQDDDITFVSEYPKKSEIAKEFKILPKMEDKTAIIKVHTNMFAEAFAFFREKGYKGLIIEGTGLGHAPINEIDAPTKEHSKIRKEIKLLIENGCTVAMCSQTINGSVNMNVYSPGRDLINYGVIGCQNMTAETAFVKLAWILGNFPKDAKNLMADNLRGEIKRRMIK